MTTNEKPRRAYVSTSEIRRELQAAIWQRKMHSDDCALWDYEGTNDCETCDRHDQTVTRLRAKLPKAPE